MSLNEETPSPEDLRKKRRIETLLKSHGYRRDDRPDHREWMKYLTSFTLQIRLDQNRPEGFNGFQLGVKTYLRWPVTKRQLDALLRRLKREFE